MKIGYFLSSEEWGPRELVELAVKAQDAGFEGLWISDHFHPWVDRQGHSPGLGGGRGDRVVTEPARAGKSAVEKTDDSPVDEFRPAPNGDAEAEGVVVKSEGSKKSILKNVHGAAYGGLDAKNRKDHDAAASVGGSSKSGKTSVYVETENSRTSAPSH